MTTLTGNEFWQVTGAIAGKPAGQTEVASVADIGTYVSSVLSPTPITKTADYTVALADNYGFIIVNSGSAVVITIPANATVAFPIGAEITVYRAGAGSLTVAAAGGVTINSISTLVVTTQYGTASLKKVGTNTWVIAGNV